MTVAAFLAGIVIGGLNAVGVRYSNQELAPFWGATLRLAIASALLFAVVIARGARLPRGRALFGIVLYGALGFGVFFAFLYAGLVHAPAGAAAVAVSLVPLATLILAPLQGLERFRWQALAGAAVSLAGIGLAFGEELAGGVAPFSLLALLAAALALAEGTIVAKRFPRSDPAVTNSIGMAVGGALLLAVTIATGEPVALPAQAQTLAALAYLSVVGSVVLFMGFLYVLQRWSASATSYQLLFMPLVTVPVAALLRAEPVGAAFVVGAALAIAGVYLGALAPPIALPWRWAPRPVAPPAPGSAAIPAVAAADGSGQPAFVPPSCP